MKTCYKHGSGIILALSLMFSLHAGERQSFDWDWRFARFGSMPDGSLLEEPGQPSKTIRASSEESGKGNLAANAVDGNATTRWCATGGSSQWLQIDFGRSVDFGKIEIDWERAWTYRPRIEVSNNGKPWQALTDHSTDTTPAAKQAFTVSGSGRFLRVTATGADNKNWASIFELRCFDRAGNQIKPQPVTSTAGSTPESVAFDDSNWRSLNLPHDWGIEGPFRADLPNETGKLPWAGIGWYRKTLMVSSGDKGKRLFLDFDGAMAHPKIYVNGKLAGQWAYGYSSFRVEITDFVQYGEKNLVAVRLDNPPDSSRWYPGGGLYRHVWLQKENPVHVGHWGVFISTPEVSKTTAKIHVQTTVDNQSTTTANVSIRQVVINPQGKEVTQVDIPTLSVASGKSGSVEKELTISTPQLWDLGTPQLYKLRTLVMFEGREVDHVETPFGIRSIEWNPEKGFLLNGRIVKLNGVCNHHDLGPLGSAVYTRGIERQLEILRDMGCNSIRTSHNPPAPELLELCDRMGFLVMDEMFDAWKMAKKPNDYHLDFDEWHERDVQNLVHRDRNHPSVILWSSGNEIPEQGQVKMHEVSKQLATIFHREDPTRKVIAGCNNAKAAFNGFADTIDVFGYNYKPQFYGEFRQKRPQQVLIGSETSSCVSSRGEYFFPVEQDKGKGFFNYQVSSYDLYAPPWAYKPDLEFEGLDKNPHVAGEYVWTGFDYLGEPTPYNQDKSNVLNFTDPEKRRQLMEELDKLGGKAPSRSSYFGILDLCGFKKDRFYLYQARWRPELPMVHILPHWNWPERVGQVTPVHVYTAASEAELFLNGKSLGRKQKGQYEYRIVWNEVQYAPGELKVIAYKNGQPWAQAVQKTTDNAARVTLEADRAKIVGDGRDLSYITVKIEDKNGALVPRSMNLIKLSVTGPAAIIAVDNGDATSHAPIQASEVKAYNGMAQVILRGNRDASGKVVLTATSAGLKGTAVEVVVGE
jgi:beta-galactosidase